MEGTSPVHLITILLPPKKTIKKIKTSTPKQKPQLIAARGLLACLKRPPPTLPSLYETMILRMSVSKKQGPFNSYRIICGGLEFDTQVYESGGVFHLDMTLGFPVKMSIGVRQDAHLDLRQAH